MIKWCTHKRQQGRWPSEGRHILAQFDDDNIVVYQAYNTAIADWAVSNQAFGGPWSFERMSWIKTNFLWMMCRCGWANKPNQERVLAVTITRTGFETILQRAVETSYQPDLHGPDRDAWRRIGKTAGVRMQWDPDHNPRSGKMARRAIQLGLRGETLRQYATEWLVRIDDITAAVHTQHAHVLAREDELLKTPCEHRYELTDAELKKRIRLSSPRQRR
jgi:hypothetical protein